MCAAASEMPTAEEEKNSFERNPSPPERLTQSQLCRLRRAVERFAAGQH